MELRDFAERILFAQTLEAKLACPDNITDDQPGSPLATPEAPGRPQELRFKPAGSGKAEFPGAHRLEKEAERGRLLHFFANHELLATELMALVLLKFPNAPAAFRRGVLQTLKEEQVHTRLYLKRMKDCGIAFGEIPVSGYFWRSVSAMASPMDYVAGLSLTFEQANLDFCRQFARAFSSVGDDATARLLDKIYRDEIGHVAYGLKWFRRWKDPQQSDWEAFCHQLKFPLSPQRAKGTAVNVEGRRAAGLDPAFINELSVYSQSKGRTPSVFVFNPFAEGHIAHRRRFTPVKHQAALARDLENLPQFLCRQDDIVLVSKRPSVEFLSSVKEAGFPLPEFVEKSDVSNLTQRKLGSLRPWAWGPDSVQLFEPLFASVTGDARNAGQCFHEGIARLYSKAWSAALLRRFLMAHTSDKTSTAAHDKPPLPFKENGEPWLCTEHDAGVAVTCLDDALAAINAIRARGHHKVVVKEALGLAGQNAIRLWEPALLGTQKRWMENALRDGPLVIEPWLERELDFSVQLEMTSAGLKLRGYTGLINDLRGQFQANWAEPNHARRPPASVLARFAPLADISSRMHRLYADIIRLLEDELNRIGYLGPIGIDSFVYRAAKGECRLKPIVEINPRYTMGRLTLELMKQVTPGCSGVFRLLNLSMIRTQGFVDFESYARSMKARNPLRLEGDPVPKISEGVVCLNDPTAAEGCLAAFQVGRTLAAITNAVEIFPGGAVA